MYLAHGMRWKYPQPSEESATQLPAPRAGKVGRRGTIVTPVVESRDASAAGMINAGRKDQLAAEIAAIKEHWK